MGRFILRRVGTGLLTVWFIYTLVFVMVRVSGDPIEWMVPDGTTQEVEDSIRRSLHLDLPIWKQYILSFTDMMQGNSGKSYHYKRDVADLYAERIGPTYSIAVPSLILGSLLGIVFGVIAAMNHDTAIDRFVMSCAVIFNTIPGFAFAILLIIIFSLWLHLLPSGTTGTWKHMVMPIISLSIGTVATLARHTRSSMMDVLNKEYLDGARMKGVKEHMVIIKHALRNSLIPVVTILGLRLGTIFGGSIVVETVFGWPGVGSLLVTAAKQRDFPVVQWGVLMLAVIVTVANILVDISYGFLDPRIRDSFK